MIKIRAHHFLCMQGFQGYGYNDEFVKHMGEIVKYIKENSNDSIKIVNYCDEVCSMCKNNTNGICEKSSSVDFMDKKVLLKLRLTNNQQIIIKDVFKLVGEKIKSFEDAYEICGNCSWSEKCLWICKLK
ncbi:hypothetical protein SAMN02745134_02024 [Clostridium acidisoli DSM 12555]|uniref:DUF1284 domain-containing protein n=1 Tax=Clostridium acidisoli DSM 12555 TaxID=1121291 RepID=A0A1W1XIT4_9CLOT|nr:DUF1284 domain-containing protein [Clostridium acidisoli]SMC23869.1 hypothetical protein SAMN02745134_02024 [Clostridium acidisoli DSM 12555]